MEIIYRAKDGAEFTDSVSCFDYERGLTLNEFVEAVLYLHSSKEKCYEEGVSCLLTDTALNRFKYALSEVRFDLLVNRYTGEYKILTIRDNETVFVPAGENSIL